MEELFQRLQERVGLTDDDAKKSVHATIEFIKEKLPAGLGDKVEDVLNGNLDLSSFFGGNNESNNNNPLDKLKDMFS